jgi:hypothetical protein
LSFARFCEQARRRRRLTLGFLSGSLGCNRVQHRSWLSTTKRSMSIPVAVMRSWIKFDEISSRSRSEAMALARISERERTGYFVKPIQCGRFTNPAYSYAVHEGGAGRAMPSRSHVATIAAQSSLWVSVPRAREVAHTIRSHVVLKCECRSVRVLKCERGRGSNKKAAVRRSQRIFGAASRMSVIVFGLRSQRIFGAASRPSVIVVDAVSKFRSPALLFTGV